MPVASRKPCAHPGCGVTVNRTDRWCATHRKQSARQSMRQRREDPVKRRALAFYSSKAWREARAVWLADHPLCVDCMADKRLVAATVVDHIVEINAGGAMLDPDNFQSLCHTCHSKKTRRDGGAW